MTATKDTADLESMRAELDGIDRQLLETLARRIECCVEIGEFKRVHKVRMMQPHRIDFVHRRAAAFAEERGIDTTFMRSLYDLIIAETCRVEDLVIAGSEPEGDD
ncbi:chorismate mutase family protein [Amycolatopsis sp. CA-230715]|uniref:chorismate mutase family protein n=1 Tax=Amycolatopsis sp. CA-230715 TaxID=2745196 RepID=UPI001C034C26|nr:chorismate mutase family protein [Amycolatopsis sp. CA-230715]QWF78800.1 hypothetical protein HUW46_02198 [Amycolatopsis sp. CA-230715]